MATQIEQTLDNVKDNFIESLKDLSDHLEDDDVRKLNADRTALIDQDAAMLARIEAQAIADKETLAYEEHFTLA